MNNPYRTEEFRSTLHLVEDKPVPDCDDSNLVNMVRSVLLFYAVLGLFIACIYWACKAV